MADLEGWKCLGCGETVRGQDGMDKHICKGEDKATERRPLVSNEFTGCVEKPPLGLRPWRIAREMRAKEITDAMQRYWEAEKLIPKEWFDELKHLVG